MGKPGDAETGVHALDRRAYRLVLSAYVTSGAAGLLFALLWTRWAGLELGRGTVTGGAVLAVYLGCLGVGARLGDLILRRVRRPMVAYAGLEILVCATSVLVKPLLALTAGWFRLAGELGPVGYVVSTAVSIGIPATLMGATFPVLVAGFVRHDAAVGRDVSRLYAANTAGAIVGALASGFVLMRAFGSNGTWAIACAAALTAAGIAFAVGRGVEAAPAAAVEELPAEETASPGAARGLVVVTALAGLSGLVVLASETLYFRLMAFAVGSTQYALALVVAAFLAGLAGGAFVASLIGDRLERPQLGIFVASAATAILLLIIVYIGPNLIAMSLVWTRAVDAPGARLGVVLFHSIVVAFPVAAAAGVVFPMLLRVAAPRAQDASGAAARLYLWNSVGTVLGTVVVGVFLAGVVRIQTLFACCAVTAAAMALLAAKEAFARRRVGVATAGVLVLATGLSAVGAPEWKPGSMTMLGFRSHHARRGVKASNGGEKVHFYREGAAGTVTVTESTHFRRLYTNGLREARRPSVDGASPESIVALLGHCPLLVGRVPTDTFVIGLGGGSTAAAAVSNPEARVTVAELEPAVVEAHDFFWRGMLEPSPLANDRLELVVDDARAVLRARPDDSLDAVVSQPSHPWIAGVGDLYSRDFLQEVGKKLRRGGVLCQWVNLFTTDERVLGSILATFADSFAHVAISVPEGSDMLLIASDEPVAFDYEKLDAYLSSHPGSRAAWARSNIDPALVARSFRDIEDYRPLIDSSVINTYNNAFVSYAGSRALFQGRRAQQRARKAFVRRGARLKLATQSVASDRRLIREALFLGETSFAQKLALSHPRGTFDPEIAAIGAARSGTPSGFAQVLELAPDYYEAALHAAHLALDLGGLAEAAQWLDRLGPAPAARRDLVTCRLALAGGDATAGKVCERALPELTTSVERWHALYAIALSRALQGDWSAARRWGGRAPSVMYERPLGPLIFFHDERNGDHAEEAAAKTVELLDRIATTRRRAGVASAGTGPLFATVEAALKRAPRTDPTWTGARDRVLARIAELRDADRKLPGGDSAAPSPAPPAVTPDATPALTPNLAPRAER